MQQPRSHLAGAGCPKCNKMTTKKFIALAREKHCDQYDYSLTVYKNARTNVTIICHKHGEFHCRPQRHLEGSKCKKCSDESTRSSANNFIKRANKVHNNKYDYSSMTYTTMKETIRIICPKHGSFEQRPHNHLNGNGCPMCARNMKRTTSQFITKALKTHGTKYDYSLVEYKNKTTKICIICPEHGKF